MSGLSDAERNELVDLIADARDRAPRVPNDADSWDVLDALAPAIEAIVARHVAAALTEAADRIDASGSVCINAHGSQCVGGIAYRDAARIVRALIPPP